MCTSCDCSPAHDHDIGEEGPAHHHPHGADRPAATIRVEREVLAASNQLAEANRLGFAASNIIALNLLSSPGSGKTTLLEKTLVRLVGKMPLAVIEGDQQTARDADRIAATGVSVFQVNTGSGCHLDAAMVARAVSDLDLRDNTLLFIENVGNLVCPAMFDLGENAKVVILSVTEGEDKPIKYPAMFRAASLCLITKTDLLPYVDFDLDVCRGYVRAVNPDLHCIEVSAKNGAGMDAWLDWLIKTRRVG